MTIHLNAFTQCSPCPQSKGQWKHPDDRQVAAIATLEHWTELAKTLERGCFDHYFGKGQRRLADDHVGTSFRPLGAGN